MKLRTPILLISIIYLITYSLLYTVSYLKPNPWVPIALLIFSGILLILPSKDIQTIPINLKQEKLSFKIILSVIILELYFFGLPILGQINYTLFGFTYLHHISLMMWTLILLGENKKKYLIIHSIYCIVILNRQFFLIGIIAYYISNRKLFSRTTKLILMSFPLIMVIALGIFRNSILNVDFHPLGNFFKSNYSEIYDFILLYVIGSFGSGFGLVDYSLMKNILIYWNTLPEWKQTNIFFSLNPTMSFLSFYILIFGGLSFLNKMTKSFKNIILILIIFLFFTFFSKVFFTTVVLAHILFYMTMNFISRIKIVV